jgi:hypothetical protein
MTEGPATDRHTLPVLTAIQAMQGTVTLARILAEGGRKIDLAGLDAEAARLCVAISLLPPHAARPLRPALVELVAEVDGLRAALPEPDTQA